MTNKVRVYGKAQNRTALGIMNAYLVMNPKATLADFEQAFPKSLNPDAGVKMNFVNLNKLASAQPENWNGFFSKDDEVLNLLDGTYIAVVSMWTKPSFERLVARAAEYGIEIAEFTEADKGFGKKGGFRLEYLNGFVPPVVEEKKSKLWIYILAAIVVLGAIAAFLFLGKGESAEPVATAVETVVEKETVVVQQVEEIEKNFNAAQFELGKADLNDAAKETLDKLAELMTNHPELKVRVVGHTSSEGDDATNQKLSVARAKVAVAYLVSKNIDESRLTFEGKGSSEPINPDNFALNRRTEFKVE